MINKNQLILFVISLLIVGFFLLTLAHLPPDAYAGNGGLVCCQFPEGSECENLQDCVPDNETCASVSPCSQEADPCTCLEPIPTFPCTDPDCQSQQSCENPAICTGDGSTPCFWNGTDCLNSPPEPTPTPTPIDGTDLRCCHSEGFETCIGGCEGCAIPTDECTAAGGIPSVGILNTFCDPRATNVVCTGGATGCCVLSEGNCEGEETILDCGSLGGIRWFESSCEEVSQCQPNPPIPTPTPTPGAFQPGDANGDGEINILDVTAILNDILGISSASENGDCNEDGQVNILDVTCVLNIVLGV